MAREQDMKAALAELEASSKPNYTEIAEKYKLGRHALSRRHQGKTTSRADYFSNHRQCLTNVQEEILIDQINRLTDCKFVASRPSFSKRRLQRVAGGAL
jgi:hypothetical protein